MSGHLALFWCLCTEVADDPAQLPTRCPGHDSPRTGDVIENRLPGGMTLGHECPDARAELTPARPQTTEHEESESA